MKKLLASMIIIVMVLGTATMMLANVQLPVDEFNINNVYYVLGENIVTGEPIINPTMSVDWVDPDQWADDIVIHTPEYYELIVENVTLGSSKTIRINEGSEEFIDKAMNIHNEMNLKTGSFYKLSIQPYHNHVTEVNGVDTYTLATSAGEPKVAYAVTDLAVEFISDEDSIQVIWDDLGAPEFEYRIVYAIGDYTSGSKQSFLNNKEGEITGLTIDSDDIESYYDPISKRNKLTYTIDENIYPGQVYSVLVEPMVEYYDGEVVNRNRNYSFIKSVSTNIQLSLVEEGDYIRLQWEIPATFKVGQDKSEYALVEATLLEYKDGQGSNLVIFDGDAASIGYFRILKPIWETQYELRIVYKAVADASKPAIEPTSNLLSYIPSEYLIKPLKPYVPKVISQKILDDLELIKTQDEIYQILVDDYLLSGYSYAGNIDDLISENVTYHIDTFSDAINFVWGAFQRIDVDVTSSTYGENVYDTNVYYDIWITDELNTLAYAEPVVKDVRYNSTTDSHVIVNNEDDIVGYRQELNFYYDTSENETIQIVPDEIYYIKVQAKKVTAQGTLVSDPTIVSIYYTYDGDTYEPPTIVKPPMKVKNEETTEDGVTVTWKESWYEAISPDATFPDVLANWLHEAWVSASGDIYKEAIENTTYFPLYKGENEIQKLRDYLATIGATTTIISRKVDLGTDNFGVSDVKYKFLKIAYQTVLDKIAVKQETDSTYSFEEYYNDLIENDRNETAVLAWIDIIPYTDVDDSTLFAYREEGLIENSSYLFIVYPYRVLLSGEILYAHYPTPIIVSTKPEETEVTPDPTVPSLYITDYTDTTITTSWKYNTDFDYELLYADVEDVTEAVAVDIELPENILDPKYPQNGEYYDVVIDDLFPLSTYYFWVRAKQLGNGTTSQWSNPAIGTTRDVTEPLAPRGVGLAPVSRITAYSYEANVTEEHIIIEWIKNSGDVEAVDNAKVKKNYSYIIEVADNNKFIDPLYTESAGIEPSLVSDGMEILEKNLVLIKSLIPNRKYYIRMKTRLTVTGIGENQLIIKDSPNYSVPIRIITLATGEEYDGFNDPALSILPTDNYEIIYDSEDKLLEFRFRDSGTDADGLADNNVDQRLISSLIENNSHEYIIDINSFEDEVITKRRITIPYTVMEAFDRYQVDLKVLADNMIIEIPSSAFINILKEQVKAFGVAPTIVIDIDVLDAYYTKEQMPEQALVNVAIPMKMTIAAKSKRKIDTIKYSDEPMSIALKTTSRYALYNQDTALYIKDAKANWYKSTDGNYNNALGMMEFNTSDVGSYGLYVIDRPVSVSGTNKEPSHWSEKYREDVYGQFTVTGLETYNPSANVPEGSVVQSVYAMVTDEDGVDLSGMFSQSVMTTIMRSGLKNNTSQTEKSITREEVISMFVRAYEIKNSEVVSVDVNIYKEIQSDGTIGNMYYGDLAKAYTIGLISDANNIRAKEAMTYGEFFTVWSRTME